MSFSLFPRGKLIVSVLLCMSQIFVSACKRVQHQPPLIPAWEEVHHNRMPAVGPLQGAEASQGHRECCNNFNQ